MDPHIYISVSAAALAELFPAEAADENPPEGLAVVFDQQASTQVPDQQLRITTTDLKWIGSHISKVPYRPGK
jgi:hypothetical protein